MGSTHDVTLYRADIRVASYQWDALTGWGAEYLTDRLVELEIDRDPPRATTGDGRPAPEIQVSFVVGALSRVAAEDRARRRIEDLGISVLASRVRERERAL